MRKLALAPAFAAILVSTQLLSQSPDTCRLQIGMNLSALVEGGTEYPFANLMKNARAWMAHNNAPVPGGLNLWDSGYQKYLQYDNDGYPLELPAVGLPGAEAPQVLRTTWTNTANLPAGSYSILWDGIGELDIWGDVSKKTVGQNKISFDLTPGVQNLLALEINKSSAADHVRNVRVLFPGTEATYLTKPFNQSWLDQLEPFGTVRFMDWALTNTATPRKWTDRTRLNDYTYTLKTGVPYEWMVALCNVKNADAWVCVPHTAGDDYISNLATLFKNQLNPGLKIYVELSTDLWNTDRAQGKWAMDSLPQNLPYPERVADRIEQVMQIWTNVFGGQSSRLVRVMAGDHGHFSDYTQRLFAKIEADGKASLIDAISPSAYLNIFPNFPGGYSMPQQVINNARHYTFDYQFFSMPGWSSHAAFAQQKGKRLVYYEGGQNFVPTPYGTQQPYCQSLLDAQTIPEMYDLYRDLFDSLRVTSPGMKTLFMHYGFISPKNCPTGSWGALEQQFNQKPPYVPGGAPDAPKYRALVDEVIDCDNAQPCPWAGAAVISGPAQVCLSNGTIYSTPQVANSYQWTVNGGTVAAGQGTNAITVIWNSTGQPFSGSVSLKLQSNGCSANGSMAITQSSLPAAWSSGDIGSPTKKGDACWDQPSGTMTVRGGGSDIYGTTDRFQFVKQPFSGDFTLVARVKSVQNTSLYAKAGIMVRESATASSKNFMVGAMPNGQIFTQTRSATGGSTVRKATSSLPVPKFLKITREGNTFKGYRSNNGTSWQLMQVVTVSMAADVWAGLAVTSKNNVMVSTATFDQISLTAGVSLDDHAADRAEFSEEVFEEKTAMFEVFPNPVGRELTLLFSSKEEMEARLSLTDLTGRMAFSEKINVLEGDNELPVALPGLPSGVYLLSLQTGDGLRVKRVVVE